MSFHAVDSSRAEGMTVDPEDRREIVFHVWYPTHDSTGALASFIEVEPEDSTFRRSYNFLGVDLLPRVRAHAIAEASLSSAVATYPVILFSHGLGTVSRLYTSLLEHLASHGYIVVGVDHPYYSGAFRLPDGRVVRNLSTNAQRQRDVVSQAEDLSFVVTILEQINRAVPRTRLVGRLDLAQLGVFGHSRGGFAAPHACRIDRRFKACVDLDGYRLSTAVMDSGITQPFMLMEEIAPWDPPPSDGELRSAGTTRAAAQAQMLADSAQREATLARMTGGGYLVVVPGAVHLSFSDMGLIAPHRLPNARQDFRRTLEITNAYLLGFFDTYLRGRDSPLVHGKSERFPEVWLSIYQPGKPKRVFPGAPTWEGSVAEPRTAVTATVGQNTTPTPTDRITREEGARRIDRYLEAAQHFGFSGAVLVADREGVLLRKGYGPADARRRVTPEMIFDMGSITKQFTAAAILLLESEGRLATTDSLPKFFPDVPQDKRHITVHQLLTHTSGLVSDVADDYAQLTRDSAQRAIFAAPLLSTPGKEFKYSNVGYSLLAMVIERLSGRPYDVFMQERIIGPARMRHTGYVIAGLDSSLVARSYTPPVDHGTPAHRLARAGGPGWNLKGNGGMLTTVDDIYAYDRALEIGRPISKAIQEKQFAEQVRRTPDLSHGYDWWIETGGDLGLRYSRAGDGPPTGISAEWRRYPADSTVMILLANNRHHGASTRRYIMPALRQLQLGATTIEPPIVRGSTATDLEALAGVYRVDSSSYFVVERNADHLTLRSVGQRAVDVMVFNRGAASVQGRPALNARAQEIFRSLAARDTATLRRNLRPDANLAATLAWWDNLEQRLGAFRSSEALGSGRLDRGNFSSTVRLCFARGMKTVRWAWVQGSPVLSSEDAYLPETFDFGAESPVEAGEWSPYWWMAGRDSLLTYDLAFNRTLTANVLRDERGHPTGLVFNVPTGEVRAHRVPTKPSACL